MGMQIQPERPPVFSVTADPTASASFPDPRSKPSQNDRSSRSDSFASLVDSSMASDSNYRAPLPDLPAPQPQSADPSPSNDNRPPPDDNRSSSPSNTNAANNSDNTGSADPRSSSP